MKRIRVMITGEYSVDPEAYDDEGDSATSMALLDKEIDPAAFLLDMDNLVITGKFI